MKVLVLSSSAFSLVNFRAEMMQAMTACGCEVHAAAPEVPEEWQDKLHALGVRYHRIQVERTGANPLQDIRSFFSILGILRDVKPERLFLYQAKTIIYGALAAQMLGIPSFALLAGLGSAYRMGDLNCKRRLIKLILRVQYRAALACCSKVFFQNTSDRDEFINSGLVRAGQVVMINGSGVNLDRFRPAPLPQEMTFIFVARLIRDKGLFEYLEAARRVQKEYPEVKFLLVGPFDTNPTAITPAELQPFLDAQVAEYCGFVEDVRPLLAQSSVFVLPSYHEGTPKSALEAMAMARPVIMTDVPGCRETVRDGENGFLVPAKDVGALVEKMNYFIATPSACAMMGQASRAYCKEKFDVAQVNRVILEAMGLGGSGTDAG